MSRAHLFTVFTPTFNRAHTLGRVYASLRAQTYTDFEWLIVDDGSTDGTEELVRGWMAEAPFPLRYLTQVHGHKKAAFNRGVREANGELFVALDSDDEMPAQIHGNMKVELGLLVAATALLSGIGAGAAQASEPAAAVAVAPELAWRYQTIDDFLADLKAIHTSDDSGFQAPALTYADGSRALVDTVMGYGWTHSLNDLLFTQRGNLYRFDGEGRVLETLQASADANLPSFSSVVQSGNDLLLGSPGGVGEIDADRVYRVSLH